VHPEPNVIGLFGATCVGKTAVSISLANELGAEIVSVDSRQIYREITIGTAKPTAAQLAAIPHHFVNERSIVEPITAAEFAGAARQRIEKIHRSGKKALLVGGSTLYAHALLFRMDDVPPIDREVRTALQARLEVEGLPALVEELDRIDPDTHAAIDLANPRRVLRALEVYYSSGRPLSDFQLKAESARPLSAEVLVLDRDRDDLYRRIDARVESMVADGLVSELKVLLKAGYDPRLQALQTIGYREAIQFLASAVDHDTMIRLIQRNTRRYAKRQLTWLRRYGGFEWAHVEEDESVPETCSRLLATIAP